MWCSSGHSSFQAVFTKGWLRRGFYRREGAGSSTLIGWELVPSILAFHLHLSDFPLHMNCWVYLMGEIYFKDPYYRGGPEAWWQDRRNLPIGRPLAKSLCTSEMHHSAAFDVSVSSTWFTKDKALCAIKRRRSVITTAWGSIKYIFMEQSLMNVW